MNADVRSALEPLYREALLKCGRDTAKQRKLPVFLDERCENPTPVKPDRAYRRLKVAAKRAKVPDYDKLRYHDLRHLFGTILSRIEGVSIEDIRLAMGHSTVQLTERYVHSDKDRVRAAVNRITMVGSTG